jgi:hypothetical protein
MTSRLKYLVVILHVLGNWLTLPKTHPYKNIVLCRTVSPNTACIEISWPTILANKVTRNKFCFFFDLAQILNLTNAPPFCFKYHLYLFTCLICCHYYMCITCREMNKKSKGCDIIFCSIPLAVLFAIAIILNLTNVLHFCFKYYILFVHVLELLSLLYVYYL